eukprot:404476-Rhodomonas_salina.2
MQCSDLGTHLSRADASVRAAAIRWGCMYLRHSDRALTTLAARILCCGLWDSSLANLLCRPRADMRYRVVNPRPRADMRCCVVNPDGALLVPPPALHQQTDPGLFRADPCA